MTARFAAPKFQGTASFRRCVLLAALPTVCSAAVYGLARAGATGLVVGVTIGSVASLLLVLPAMLASFLIAVSPTLILVTTAAMTLYGLAAAGLLEAPSAMLVGAALWLALLAAARVLARPQDRGAAQCRTGSCHSIGSHGGA